MASGSAIRRYLQMQSVRFDADPVGNRPPGAVTSAPGSGQPERVFHASAAPLDELAYAIARKREMARGNSLPGVEPGGRSPY